MLNFDKLDKRAVHDVASQLGWENEEQQHWRDAKIPDEYVKQIVAMDVNTFVDKFLAWNGILGFGGLILDVVNTTMSAYVKPEPIRTWEGLDSSEIASFLELKLGVTVEENWLTDLSWPVIECDDNDPKIYIKFMSNGGGLDALLGGLFVEACRRRLTHWDQTQPRAGTVSRAAFPTLDAWLRSSQEEPTRGTRRHVSLTVPQN